LKLELEVILDETDTGQAVAYQFDKRLTTAQQPERKRGERAPILNAGSEEGCPLRFGTKLAEIRRTVSEAKGVKRSKIVSRSRSPRASNGREGKLGVVISPSTPACVGQDLVSLHFSLPPTTHHR